MKTRAVAILAAFALLSSSQQAVWASPGQPDTAIVAMGDSYISGEGGRWQGNSYDWQDSRHGTDRAHNAAKGVYEVDKVYPSGTPGIVDPCHRSDVSEPTKAIIPVAMKINIACTGATTQDLFRTSHGGTWHNGQPPQGDILEGIAKRRDVRMIVLSIGGNDLGFADIISDCVFKYVHPSGGCAFDQQAAVDSKIAAMELAVGKVLNEIKSIMNGAGYPDLGSYRIVLQSYPSPLPRASENRYTAVGNDRIAYGCPMNDGDLDWARDKLVPQISNSLKKVAAAHYVDFLDLRDTFQGREVCSTSTASVNGLIPPNSIAHDWARNIELGVLQGDKQESMHPNAFGQQALSMCLSLVWWAKVGGKKCTNRPGQAANLMDITPIPSFKYSYINTGTHTIPHGPPIRLFIDVLNRPNETTTKIPMFWKIMHPYRGYLRVSVIAPSGKEYLIVAPDLSDSSDDYYGNFTLSGISEKMYGRWELRIYDTGTTYTGTESGWSLLF